MTNSCPMLRLVPLDVSECTAILVKKGKTPTKDWISSFAADGDTILNTEAKASEEYKRPRHTIALKLCPANTDIVDVDDDYEPAVVIHSSKFDDGSVAATVSLGRNNATGIKWTAISRAVCHVSLSVTSSSSSGNKREKEIVDLASLPTGKAYYDEETPPITNNAVVDLAESPEDDVVNDVKKPPNDFANSDNKKEVAVASLGMRKPAGKHHVYLDGELVDKPLGREVPLQNGSILALQGPNGIAYQVHIFQSGDDPKAFDAICNSPKRRKTSPPLKNEETPTMEKEDVAESASKQGTPVKEEEEKQNKRQQLRERAHKLMVGECTCALCMDILVKSTFAYPCGHAFCGGCAQDFTDAANATNAPARSTRGTTYKGTCPSCRQDLLGWMPARSFDTQVWAIALQGCFERSDAEYYLERREECGEDAPTDVERGSILNTEENGKAGISMMNGLISHNPSFDPPNMQTLSPLRNVGSMIRKANNGNNYASVANQRGKSDANEVICID